MPNGGTLDFGVRSEARLRGRDRARHRLRDAGRGARASVRAVLHDQGAPQHGARAERRLRHRAAPWRADRRGERRGTRDHVHDPAPEPGGGVRGEAGGHRVRAVRAAGPAARVLVIDDERSVRELLVDILASAGHVPLSAADGASGLALLERVEPLDLALIDLGLPGMSGWEVAARLRAGRPELPLVLITGWGDRLDPAELDSARHPRGDREALPNRSGAPRRRRARPHRRPHPLNPRAGCVVRLRARASRSARGLRPRSEGGIGGGLPRPP